jgi:hypothetical protein
MLRVDCMTVVQNYVGHRSLSLACDFAIYSPKGGGEDNNVFVMVKSTYQLYMLKESCPPCVENLLVIEAHYQRSELNTDMISTSEPSQVANI